ncbi:MAG: UDP-N-acetylmuramoyl-L-alanyl-D-glutamate--2,6-diaminopimelate ligase [Candidatus Edwardsbacteria bacterium]|nr:UDP-N-acetylmuramoyl-L-alanyl-D-glutamate--2,6-diaminopimelate ligase [Candidatus Edwardsbacteria bacterium]
MNGRPDGGQPVTLSELLRAVPGAEPQPAAADPMIGGLQYDSRQVRPGDLFFAVPGYRTDGRRFVADAVRAGAAAVVAEGRQPLTAPAVVRVADVREAMSLMAARFFGFPAAALEMVAITGTAGKTTTSFLARAIFDAAGRRTGLLGTISYQVLGQSFPAPNTTPESLDLQRLLAVMRGAGVGTVVMEASSHGIELQRTAGIDFQAAAFTNFSQDHLDFHGTMDDYLRSKLKLFRSLAPTAAAVINRDDPEFPQVAAATRARVVGFGLNGPAEVTASDIAGDLAGSRFTIRIGDRQAPAALALTGRHNVANALCAAAIAHSRGVGLETIVRGLGQVAAVPGRFERVDAGQDFTVVVDYAHTPEELERLLQAARALAGGRIITVFGCGGDRDRAKRPLMGRAVADGSDVVIVTSDNPRTERPRAIIDDILPGVGRKPHQVQVDRADAIRAGIAAARTGDLVIIAGKGHEDYQIIGTEKVHFDDREAARAALAQRMTAEGR